jgi:hypothetical protein
MHISRRVTSQQEAFEPKAYSVEAQTAQRNKKRNEQMTAFTRKSIINRHPFLHVSPECIYEKYTEERVLCSSTLSIESEKAEQGAAVHFKRLVLHSRNSRQLNIRPTRSRVLVQGDTEKNVLPGIPDSRIHIVLPNNTTLRILVPYREREAKLDFHHQWFPKGNRIQTKS